MRILALAVLVGLASAARAEAQIYAWKDANGNMVLSDRSRPDGGEVRTFEVPGTQTVRVTKAEERVTVSGRARFDDIIDEHAQLHRVSPALIRAVIQLESGFNPWAVSPKGALGLMQLMPATARELGVDNPFHPAQNIRGGVTYLRRLLDLYDQDVPLALAAYNAGPGAVARYGDVPPYRETQEYVRRITTATRPAPPPPPSVIYKWLDVVNGRPIVRYGNKPPAGTAHEVVGRR
ncbi:MAG: lytic transglycosylase domain-containing protein [Vicinamibacterales bacterium]